MSEARLLDQIEIVRCDPNDPEFERVKARLAEGTKKQAIFPTVEIEPDVYKSDSDELIAHYAATNDVEPANLPALSFYKDGILPQLIQFHEEHPDL
jgi:hypothetical protein